MSPRWTVAALACGALLAWAATDSAAIGVMCLGYGVAGTQALARRRSRAAREKARAESLELIASAAADLRAGAPAPPLVLPDPDLDRLACAAQRISDRTGAPLADLLDRLEQQQTALSRLDSAAHAQSTGLRTSAMLLLGLPLIGLALGHIVGANAVGVLLHTELGQVCAALAVSLQLAGLAWTDRLARGAGRPRATRPPEPGLGARLRAVGLGRPISAPRLGDGQTIAVAGNKLVRRGPAATGNEAELAVAADLIAASLRAGAPVGTAVLVAGETLAGPLSPTLTRIGHELRMGVPPAQAWRPLALVAQARRVINAARRSAESGAALSGALTRCADDLRADAEHARQARAQRAAVLLVLPLGLCFLPAFVLAGLVPVVIAVLREVL